MSLDREELGASLDAWAAATFAGDHGTQLLAPWLERWREDIGDVRPDDPQFEAWAEARTDWALVDMGAGRATVGRDPSFAVVATSWVGVFEVWPTEGAVRAAWVRDRVGGACGRLAIPIDLRRESSGPAALWELRVIVQGGVLVPCRAPVAYPLALVGAWRETPTLPDPSRPSRVLTALRRARLRHARTPRMDPALAYGAALRVATGGD